MQSFVAYKHLCKSYGTCTHSDLCTPHALCHGHQHGGKMRITDLKTYVVGNPWKNWVFVKLITDEGITGLGEATGGLATMPNLGDVEELRRHVIGEDPHHPERLWYKMHKAR